MRTDCDNLPTRRAGVPTVPAVLPVQNIRPLHSYRAHLVPDNANAADLEDLADLNLLPTIRVKAASATQAEAFAHLASGKGVLRVERVEARAEA